MRYDAFTNHVNSSIRLRASHFLCSPVHPEVCSLELDDVLEVDDNFHLYVDDVFELERVLDLIFYIVESKLKLSSYIAAYFQLHFLCVKMSSKTRSS